MFIHPKIPPLLCTSQEWIRHNLTYLNNLIIKYFIFFQCVGYWKENLKSYLITYDQLDAFTKYRCWVYQRADLNKMMMSMSVGPFCDINQDVDSKDWKTGAVVAIKMDENERECKQLYFSI